MLKIQHIVYIISTASLIIYIGVIPIKITGLFAGIIGNHPLITGVGIAINV